MKITKYEHACLDIEQDGKRLIIDPGVFTTSLNDFDNIAAVVVTHVHPDHLDVEKLKAIQIRNPNAKFFSVAQAANELNGVITTETVENGKKIEVEGFKLEFFGHEHAVIHESLPKFENVGVMVNDILYYPGDSFTIPHVPVKILATPVSAPWLKMSEVIDFVIAVKPVQLFATHDAILSEAGMSVSNKYLPIAGEKVGTGYVDLKPGESVSV